jgi:hypothetical protein
VRDFRLLAEKRRKRGLISSMSKRFFCPLQLSDKPLNTQSLVFNVNEEGGFLSRGGARGGGSNLSGREAEHSHLSSAEVGNILSCISHLLRAFMGYKKKT